MEAKGIKKENEKYFPSLLLRLPLPQLRLNLMVFRENSFRANLIEWFLWIFHRRYRHYGIQFTRVRSSCYRLFFISSINFNENQSFFSLLSFPLCNLWSKCARGEKALWIFNVYCIRIHYGSIIRYLVQLLLQELLVFLLWWKFYSKIDFSPRSLCVTFSISLIDFASNFN